MVKEWVNRNNLVLIFILIYFLLSIIKLEHPGVNNDQLMFVNSATLNPDNMFLWKSFHGIPTMIFPYIGALKSYFYMPIFFIFGVNIWSIRLPQILLISITWFMLYKTLILVFDKKLALLTILLLCIDPTIIAYSKVDVGPTVLEFFLKVMSLYILFFCLVNKKTFYLFGVFPISVLGIFNKINFIWFANALVISFFIVYFKDFYNNFRISYKKDLLQNPQHKILPIIGYLFSYILVIRFFVKLSKEVTAGRGGILSEMNISDIFQNLSILTNNLIGIINGNIFFNMVYGYNPTSIGLFISLIVLSIVIFSFYKASRIYYFFGLLVALMVLQILLTKQAVKAWHALSIYPFFTILFAASLLRIYTALKQLNFKYFFALFIGGFVLYELLINIIYLKTYSSPTSSLAYSSKIYDLVGYTRLSSKQVVCLDVDICNQLSSLTQQQGKYKEPFFFLDPQTYNYTFTKLSDNFKNPKNYLYIAHAEDNSHFKNFRESFFKYLNENKIKYEEVERLTDGQKVVFEIYKVGYY